MFKKYVMVVMLVLIVCLLVGISSLGLGAGIVYTLKILFFIVQSNLSMIIYLIEFLNLLYKNYKFKGGIIWLT